MLITRQQGQAIAEFNVTAAFLLVPLFILIPLMGKYIDMKHSSVEAARYMAWERTVWFEKAPKYTSTAAVKSTFILEKETISRVFGNTDRLVSRSDSGGLGVGEVNMLWKDHGGRQLVSYDSISAKIPKGDEEVPSASYRAFNIATNIIDIPANYIGDKLIDALNWFNDGAETLTGRRPIPVPNSPLFDIVTKFHFEGYYRPEVRVAVNNIPNMSIFDTLNLEIVSRAAILTDSWSAAGNEGKKKQDTQFAKWADSFVPFAKVRPLFKPAQDVFSYKVLGVSIAPELGADSLIFGFVDTDPVTDSSIIPACPAGVCSFE